MRFVQLLSLLPLLVCSAALADDVPGGLRWGVAVAPSLLVVGAPAVNDDGSNGTSRTTAGGVSIPVRLGYQFARKGLLGFGVYAEPRLSIFAKSADGTTATVLVPSGSAMAELDVGPRFFVAAGITVGGQISFVDSQSGRGPAMGGFTLRVGTTIPLRSLARPRAMTVALEAMALFGSSQRLDSDGDRIDGTSGTASMGTLGLAVGFDAF